MVKKILSILTWAITAAGIITLFVFSHNSYLNTPLKDIDIRIERANEKGFIKADTLRKAIDSICHVQPNGLVGSIDMCKVEQYLHGIEWIGEASSFIDLDGVLHVTATEYEPVLRVYNSKGESVYVTENGTIVPVSNNYTPRVLIASGHFNFPTDGDINDSVYQASGIADALCVWNAIKKDKFYVASIGQIYRNEARDFQIAVRGIDSQVVLGDTTNIDNKLMKLKVFMQHKNGSDELRGYSRLNLKFHNQIVCTKKKIK